MTDNEILNSEEAAQLLRISVRTLLYMRKDGRAPRIVRLGYGKKIGFLRRDLDAWIEAHTEQRAAA